MKKFQCRCGKLFSLEQAEYLKVQICECGIKYPSPEELALMMVKKENDGKEIIKI